MYGNVYVHSLYFCISDHHHYPSSIIKTYLPLSETYSYFMTDVEIKLRIFNHCPHKIYIYAQGLMSTKNLINLFLCDVGQCMMRSIGDILMPVVSHE